MEDNFRDVEVGETDAIQGTVDDVVYNLWGMKDPHYVLRIMDTGGRLLEDDKCKETVIIWKENGDAVKNFKYKVPIDWYFYYRHAVDDHNNLRNSLPSIEVTWVTDWWECWLFAFILAISEINEFLITCYFVYCRLRREGISTLLEFFRKLAGQLINNISIKEREGGWLVLARIHSSVDDCTKACDKISELEVDLHYKNCLSTEQLQL